MPGEIAIERAAMALVKSFEGTHVAARVTQHELAIVV
jgi:hypothetical protein